MARRARIVPALAVTTCLAVAACGGGSGSTGTSPAGQTHGTSTSTSTSTQATSIGRVLATTSGRTLYELVGETAGAPMCTGGCLSVWPSATSGSGPLVVSGHPAHTYVSDTAPGQANGEGVKDQWGTWLALSPAGTPIPANGGSPGPSRSTGSGGGGYGY